MIPSFCFRGPVTLLRMPERGRDFPLAELSAVIAFDQQSDPAAVVDVARPAERFIEQAEFLVEPALLFHRRNGFGARRAAVNPVGHISSPVTRDGRASAPDRRLPAPCQINGSWDGLFRPPPRAKRSPAEGGPPLAPK